MDQNREWVLQAKINMVPEQCSSWKSWDHSLNFPSFFKPPHSMARGLFLHQHNIFQSLSVSNSSHNLSKKAPVVALDPRTF